jgi:hypothetical protein
MGYLLSAISYHQEWKRRYFKLDGNSCFNKTKKTMENKCIAFNTID